MECLLEPAASEVQVVPVQGTARSRGDGETQQGEDRGPARHHVVEVEEEGGAPVLVHQHPRLLGVEGVEVVHVGLVVAPDTVGDNLQSLRKSRAEPSRRAWRR